LPLLKFQPSYRSQYGGQR